MTSIHFHPCSKLILRLRPVSPVSSAGVSTQTLGTRPLIRLELPQRTKWACSAANRSHRNRIMTVVAAQHEANAEKVRLGDRAHARSQRPVLHAPWSTSVSSFPRSSNMQSVACRHSLLWAADVSERHLRSLGPETTYFLPAWAALHALCGIAEPIILLQPEPQIQHAYGAPCAFADSRTAYVQKFVERGQPVEGPPGPIIVCTRNNDLQGVLDSTPKDRREGNLTSA